jgi:tetratricopeptide (TPR) repeat protein
VRKRCAWGASRTRRNIYKQLLREDPNPEWTERLGDAYAGRAHALADKGMFKEAAMVLENTLGPGKAIREPLLYIACLVRQNQAQKAGRVALDAMARLPAGEAIRLAESATLLSLAAPTSAPAETKADGNSWAEQTCAAEAALLGWLRGQSDEEIDRLLGRIPLRSAFGPMRLVLKSLIATADPAKTQALLAMIQPGSVFAGVRDAVASAVTGDDGLIQRWSSLRPAQQQFVAEFRGVPRERMELLTQIAEAEKRGPAALFALLTRRNLPVPDHELREACLNLLPAVPDRIGQFTQRFGPLPGLELSRIRALGAEARDAWIDAFGYWKDCLRLLQQNSEPESRLRQGVVMRHLADLLRRYPDLAPDSDSDPAAEWLERSIEVDPDHLPATLALLDLYREAEDLKPWHRAADAAAVRFPANTTVLLHAVDSAVARGAYKKAVGFGRQVLSVDPINAPVRQRMIELQLAHARKQMRSGRADLAAKSLDEAGEWDRAETPSASLRIARALVAATEPNENAVGLIRAAVQETGGGTLGWFRFAVEASLAGWSEQQLRPFAQELKAAQNTKPDRELVMALVGLLGQRQVRASPRSIRAAMQYLHPYLYAAAAIDWAQPEFLSIADLMAELHLFHLVQRFAMQAGIRDRDNLHARFYKVVAQCGGKRESINPAAEDELFEMLEQAGERQDFTLTSWNHQFRDRLVSQRAAGGVGR